MHEGLDGIMDPDMAAMIPNDPSVTFHRDRVREYANNFEVVLEEQPSSYPFNFVDKELPFYFAVDQFMGGEGVNRIEVNVEFSADLSPGEEDLTEKTYRVSAAFLDSGYKVIARESRAITLPTVPRDPEAENEEDEEGGDRDSRLIPAQILFTLPENYYRIAIAVEEGRGNRSTAYKTTMAFNNYRYDLSVSDMIFASKIAPADKQSPFNRGALEVVPHPLRRYIRGEPVPVYFEIYNLETDDGGCPTTTSSTTSFPPSSRRPSSGIATNGVGPLWRPASSHPAMARTTISTFRSTPTTSARAATTFW